jgi:hypothetical protein
MLIPRLIVFALAASALGGCCLSGSGCSVPMQGDLAAWDGRGSPTGDGMASDDEAPPSTAISKADGMSAPMKRGRGKMQSEAGFAEREAADMDADAKLASKMVICNGCGPSGRDDAATGRPMRDRAGGTAALKIHEMDAPE